MSFYTDGNAEQQLNPGTIYPGNIDPTLIKGPDVHYFAGPKIVLSEHMPGMQLVSLPQMNAQQMLLRKRPIMPLGDNVIHSSNEILTGHLYNQVKDSVPTASLMSVRDWR